MLEKVTDHEILLNPERERLAGIIRQRIYAPRPQKQETAPVEAAPVSTPPS